MSITDIQISIDEHGIISTSISYGEALTVTKIFDPKKHDRTEFQFGPSFKKHIVTYIQNLPKEVFVDKLNPKQRPIIIDKIYLAENLEDTKIVYKLLGASGRGSMPAAEFFCFFIKCGDNHADNS